jgi:hypothetical protein
MRKYELSDVSISPWRNPYAASDTNTGRQFYATAPVIAAQPQYFRTVAPIPPALYALGVTQVIDDDGDDDNKDQAGMLGR